MHQDLQPRDLARAPALIAIDVVDTALHALVTALASQHPRLERGLLPLEPYDLQLRRAQSLAGLANVLRSIAVEYRAGLLDSVRRDDLPY